MVNSQSIHEIKDVAMVANTKAIARLEGQLSHLVAEFSKIEKEKFQSQEMAKGKYMIDDEHVQATTFGSEEMWHPARWVSQLTSNWSHGAPS